MHCIHFAATTLLLAFAGSAAVDAAENETVGQFLISMPVRSVAPDCGHSAGRRRDVVSTQSGHLVLPAPPIRTLDSHA
jgi:hypothetical protein